MKGNEIIAILSGHIEGVESAVHSVTGALLTAIFLRHNTKAEEFERIKAGKFAEVTSDLLDSGKLTYTEYYKANNFLTIAKKADKYYKDNPRINTKEPYDFDWFVRFFEAAGNISDETMQDLWAKILAGEIAQPTSFSLKTIDVMRSLNKRNAELFLKICSHSFISGVRNCFLPNEDEYLEHVGITYEDIMKLNELGLMHKDAFISLDISICNEPLVLIVNRGLVMTISSSSGKQEKVNIGQFPFMVVGEEISTLIGESASDEDFLRYGEVLSSNPQYNISIHKVICWEGDSIKYETKNLIQTKVAERINE